MKKVLSFVAALGLVAVLSACDQKQSGAGGTNVDNPNLKDGKTVIGVSLPTQREARWVNDKKTMEAYGKEKGIDVKVVAADAKMDQQIKQVETMISTEPLDVLMIAPEDATAAAPLVEKAKAKGISVISYDRLITGTKNLDYYISFNAEEVGQMQGKYLVDNCKAKDLVLVGGATTDNNAKLYFSGAMSQLEPKIKAGAFKVIGGDTFEKVSTENWLPAKAQDRVKTLLTQNSSVKDVCVLAPNDGLAGGVVQALKSSNVKYVVTGQDAEKAAALRIKAGEQNMTVLKDTNLIAKKAIDMAMNIIEGKAVPTNAEIDASATGDKSIMIKSELLKSVLVDKSNVQKLLIDTNYGS